MTNSRALMRGRRVQVTVLLGLAGLLGSGVMHGPPAAAHPGVPLPLFDADETQWASVPGLSEQQFTDSVEEYAKNGFMVIDIDADVDAATDELRLNLVYQLNSDGRAWLVNPRMTETQYEANLTWATRNRLRLVDFETYVQTGRRYFAAVWVENRENLASAHSYHLTKAQFEDMFNQQKGRRLPIDVDIYPLGTGLRWSVIWIDNTDGLSWALKPWMTEGQFDTAWGKYGDGMRMLVHDSAMDGAKQLHAGIWIQNTSLRSWALYRDMSYQGYLNRWYRMVDEGYRLIGDERYETADGTRYSQVWRQNSARPAWQLKPWVDALIEQELDDFDVPGISVAVIQDGEFRYLRGFGHADVDSDVWLDSGHVLRLASVSKGIAGVLTMRLAEDGNLVQTDSIQTHLPALPDDHQYSVEELVSNRGCVRHYADIEDDPGADAVDQTMAATLYTDAQTPAALFWDDPLVCEPGAYSYSTHGYTILGAAFEGATGQNIFQLFDDRLRQPFALGTLRLEDQADLSVRRSKIYRTDNSEASLDQLSWKALGGGLESSVNDLARFGAKLIQGQILSQPSLDTMWATASWGYAYGWWNGTDDGRLFVAKDGNQRGARSYLRMYPDDGIVIAVLSNRDGGGHSAIDLGTQIGTWVLSTLP